MPNKTYDMIVAGTGSMGAAACYYLAEKGHKVLGLEQFGNVPHDNGSHGGQSRIIRKAYFEHPDYVPLLNRAYNNWRQLEEAMGERLYLQTGLVYSGPADHPIISGVKHTASVFGIPLDKIDDRTRFPFFKVPDEHEMLFETDAGFLLPGKAIAGLVKEARKTGAVINTGETMLDWKEENGEVTVITPRKKYSAKKLIITTGAWTSQVLKDMEVPLKITRQVLVWVHPVNSGELGPEDFPCWLIADHTIKGAYYGFPYLDGNKYPGPSGLKFGLHYPGTVTDPGNVNREIDETELSEIINGIRNYFPLTGSPVVHTTTCLYSNTPDENFIIDHLPGSKNVIIACGFSGHGFKFVPVVGEILAELATEGRTSLPIDFLGLNRFVN
jgi:sarcosine oxidase